MTVCPRPAALPPRRGGGAGGAPDESGAGAPDAVLLGGRVALTDAGTFNA
ncbi:MAG: hypothetical protein ABW073_06145 [Acidimicrobiia bacterium]